MNIEVKGAKMKPHFLTFAALFSAFGMSASANSFSSRQESFSIKGAYQVTKTDGGPCWEDDFVRAMGDAFAQADKACGPLSAERMSDWTKVCRGSYYGGPIVAEVIATFICSDR